MIVEANGDEIQGKRLKSKPFKKGTPLRDGAARNKPRESGILQVRTE